MTYLLALDQGTSSSRSIVFDAQGQVVAQAQQELPQIYPQPGWVEHDPKEIWRTQLATAREALAKAGLKAGDIRALGITNQRETTVLWHRKTGQPVHHAIVWQDRRGEPMCAQLREQGHARADPVAHRAADRLVFFRRPRSNGCWTTCRGAREQAAARRTGLRHRGQLAVVATDGRGAACDRRDQCLAHHVVRYPSQRLGSRNCWRCWTFRRR